MDNDGLTGDLRAREDDYFRRKDQELIEKMRRAAAETQARQELQASSGLQDPELLQELQALGFTPDTVPLLPLIPVVQVAWAEGHVSDAERELILRIARERGIEPGTAAGDRLAAWLSTRPSDDVFARATRLVRAMLESPAGDQAALRADDLLRQCEEIAAASGGLLGFGKVSAQERAILKDLEAALKAR